MSFAPKLAGQIFLLFATLAGVAVAQPGGETCRPTGLSTPSPLTSSNLVYLRFQDESFPETFVNPFNSQDVISNFRTLMKAAMTDAAIDWNQSCEDIPALNDQPVLIPADSTFTLPAGTQNAVYADVRYVKGFSPDSAPCPYFPQERCFSAVGRTIISPDKIDVLVFELSGRESAPVYTPLDFRGVYNRIFAHELGHVLLLGHDECPNSPMNLNILNRSACAPNDPSCEPKPRQEHCDQMTVNFEPADPLGKVLGEDPDSLCRLRLYCDYDFSGPLTPWAKIRSGCVWFADVTQGFVDSYDQDGEHLGSSVQTFTNFRCFSGGHGSSLGLISSSSPFLMIAHPKPGAVVTEGLMKLTGFAWGRSHGLREVRVFIDRTEATLYDYQQGLDSTFLCQEGFDPAYCDRGSGFTGRIDLHGITPGLHKVLVVATDMAADPLPSQIELEILVPGSLPNHTPSPQDDAVVITMTNGLGWATQIDVLANDFDVDGQPIELAASAIVTYPSQGSVYRVNGRALVYTPFPWATGTDSFSYRIIDSMGTSGIAEVQVEFMETIFLP